MCEPYDGREVRSMHGHQPIKTRVAITVIPSRRNQPVRFAEKVNIDSAAVTRHLKQLEAKGMVTRRRKPEDNRVTLVRLTEEGRTRIEASKKEKERFISEMLENVSDEERKLLTDVLSRIQQNIEKIQTT